MNYRIFSLGSNDTLAKKIAERVGVPLGKIECKVFSDGEQHVQFLENIRGKDIYIVQSTNPPADNWVRLLLAIDAARNASAREITVVIPYFGYTRQDRKSKSGEPISVRIFATILETLGADRVLAMDLHSDVIGGFFRSANIDLLYARPVFISFFKDFFKEALTADDLVIVSPDTGGVNRAQSYAKRLMTTAELAVIHKEREQPNKITHMRLVGDVKNKVALIVDDMADTCGTLCRATSLLVENGAREVYAVATHGVLSGEAIKSIDESVIKRVFITDTIYHQNTPSSKIQVISVGDIIGDAIVCISNGESLHSLFE